MNLLAGTKQSLATREQSPSSDRVKFASDFFVTKLLQRSPFHPSFFAN
jgi:hypothetical protein